MMPVASVMMKGGIFKTVTPRPLKAPTRAQTSTTAGSTAQASASEPSSHIVVSTPPRVMTDAIDRSRPRTRMTRPWPKPTMTRKAER